MCLEMIKTPILNELILRLKADITKKNNIQIILHCNIKSSKIIRIWEHVCSFCTAEFQPDDLGVMNVKDMFMKLRREIGSIKNGLMK